MKSTENGLERINRVFGGHVAKKLAEERAENMRKGIENRKKGIFNAIMGIAAVAIVFAAVMVAGSVRGWFEPQTQPTAGGRAVMEITAQDKRGSANIERNGIAYKLEDGTRLRDGDIIETLNNSTVTMTMGNSSVVLNQNSEVTIHVAEDGSVAMTLGVGEIFAEANDPLRLYVMDSDVFTENGVFAASAPSGSASVYLFAGTAEIAGEALAEGESATLLSDGMTRGAVAVRALNDFSLEQVRRVNGTRTLCFTNSQLNQVEEERAQVIRAALENKKLQEEQEQQIAEQREKNKEKLEAQEQAGENIVPGHGATAPGTAGENAGAENPHCTIEIRCDTILNNLADLTEGKNAYVPANGTILATSTLEFAEGETVLDVLQRACSLAEIQLEYSWTPMFDSYYVEGINNLYEFDCGQQSGWMYQVNGWYPNYGCSAYALKDGDVIVWNYTCKGYGADLGAPMS